jgi:glycosyl transferase family 25
MKIFVINLKKDKDRLDNMINNFNKYNFHNWERIDAVNGKELGKKYGKLNYSETGCYLSHLKTLKLLLEQKLEYAVIDERKYTVFLLKFGQ